MKWQCLFPDGKQFTNWVTILISTKYERKVAFLFSCFFFNLFPLITCGGGSFTATSVTQILPAYCNGDLMIHIVCLTSLFHATNTGQVFLSTIHYIYLTLSKILSLEMNTVMHQVVEVHIENWCEIKINPSRKHLVMLSWTGHTLWSRFRTTIWYNILYFLYFPIKSADCSARVLTYVFMIVILVCFQGC